MKELCWWCEEAEGTVLGDIVNAPGDLLDGKRENFCRGCWYFLYDEEEIKKVIHEELHNRSMN